MWFPRQVSCHFLFQKVKVKSLSRAGLFATPWIVACTKLLRPWDFQGKSTGVDCHFLLQGNLPWRGVQVPRDRTQVSHIVDRHFTVWATQSRDQTRVSCISCMGKKILYHWATREAQKDWSSFISKCVKKFFSLIVQCSAFTLLLTFHSFFSKLVYSQIFLNNTDIYMQYTSFCWV